MLFNSLQYIALLSASVVLYWAVPKLWMRQMILLATSLVFYASWSAGFLIFLVISVLVAWASVEYFVRTRKPSAITLVIVGLLCVLGYFKYSAFFAQQIGEVILFVNGSSPRAFDTLRDIILPLGISFYTFQIISYVVDVRRGVLTHEKNPLTFLLFVTYFPHLIAGPICRGDALLPQLNRKQSFDLALFYDGLFMFLGGFVMKTSFADGFAPYANAVFSAPAKHSGLENLLGTIAFSAQIFGDFWGYSLMALGSAALFGYRLPHNFALPYLATSIQDFWRRWHITLSQWLRDYLYIPLGGSKGVSPLVTYFALLATMAIGGLWHGASWAFVAWGCGHGLALIIQRWLRNSPLADYAASAGVTWVATAWLLTQATVIMLWIPFRAGDLTIAMQVYEKIFLVDAAWATSEIDIRFYELMALFVPAHLLIHRYTYSRPISGAPALASYLLIPVLTVIAVIYFTNGSEFLYFQF